MIKLLSKFDANLKRIIPIVALIGLFTLLLGWIASVNFAFTIGLILGGLCSILSFIYRRMYKSFTKRNENDKLNTYRKVYALFTITFGITMIFGAFITSSIIGIIMFVTLIGRLIIEYRVFSEQEMFGELMPVQ